MSYGYLVQLKGKAFNVWYTIKFCGTFVPWSKEGDFLENDVIRVRASAELKKQLKIQAIKENISVSELIRRYIDKGMCIDGYKTQLDMISEITEQSVKNAFAPQVERIIKMLMKIGKIDGATYFFQLCNLITAKDNRSVQSLNELVSECNTLAIRYMSQKDYAVDKFLTKNPELIMKAIRLKDPYYGIIDDV